jgi:hypothetical protein
MIVILRNDKRPRVAALAEYTAVRVGKTSNGELPVEEGGPTCWIAGTKVKEPVCLDVPVGHARRAPDFPKALKPSYRTMPSDVAPRVVCLATHEQGAERCVHDVPYVGKLSPICQSANEMLGSVPVLRPRPACMRPPNCPLSRPTRR